MTLYSRATAAAALAALLVASSVTASDAVARSKPYPWVRTFDGLWSVSILTRHGDCAPAYRYPVQIWYGRLFKADNDPSFRVYGAVARSGAIGVTISGHGETARGYGRLTRNYGRGLWRTTNGECSGLWTAKRRG